MRAYKGLDVLRVLVQGQAPLDMMQQVMNMFPAEQQPSDEDIAKLLHEKVDKYPETERNLFHMIRATIPALHVGYAFKKFRDGPSSFFVEIAAKCGPVNPQRDHNPAHIILRHCKWLLYKDTFAILDALEARGISVLGSCRRHVCCAGCSLYNLSNHHRVNERLWFAGSQPARQPILDEKWAYTRAAAMGTLIVMLATRRIPRDVIRFYIAPIIRAK